MFPRHPDVRSRVYRVRSESTLRSPQVVSPSACSPIETSPSTTHFDESDQQRVHTAGQGPSIWATYIRIADDYDAKILGKWDSGMDTLLIFAALFSAIVTAFLINAMNGLQPNYAQISSLMMYQILTNQTIPGADPTAVFTPSMQIIVVNCLWFVSLAFSLSVSMGAMLCKEWFKQYGSGVEPVVHLERACRRQSRFMALHRWNVGTVVALLPTLLHASVLLFLVGLLDYLWPICQPIALLLSAVFGTMSLLYFLLVTLPLFTLAPFRTYTTDIIECCLNGIAILFSSMSNGAIFVSAAVVRLWVNCLILPIFNGLLHFESVKRWAGSIILWLHKSAFMNANYKPFHFTWAPESALIDTSEPVQEAALLFLLQTPISDSDAEEVVSNLELVTRTRIGAIAQPAVITCLGLWLESAFHEDDIIAGRFQLAIDCVLILARIKFHHAIRSNEDGDDNVGGVRISPLVAYAAQALLESHTNGDTRLKLLAAAAWLSPVDAKTRGEKLRHEIRSRDDFVCEIRAHLKQHADGRRVDDRILIDLIHGMHASIPRQGYGIPSSITSFLPVFSDVEHCSRLESDAVLSALALYALDLVSPNSCSWAKQHELGFLITKLLKLLNNDPYPPMDVLRFVFCLIHKAPHILHAKRTPFLLSKISRILTVNGKFQRGLTPLDVYCSAIKAYAASLELTLANADPKNVPRNVVKDILRSIPFVKQGLNIPSARLSAIYTVSMALYLLPSHVSEILKDISPVGLADILIGDGFNMTDMERGTEHQLENAIHLHIHTILVLNHCKLDAKLGGDRCGRLIHDIETVAVKHPCPLLRWKASYLLVLFTPLLSGKGPVEVIATLNEDFQRRLSTGELYLVKDWEKCKMPLTQSGLGRLSQVSRHRFVDEAAFEWIRDFPVIPYCQA